MGNKWISSVALSAASLILTSAIAFSGGLYGPGVTDNEIKIGNTMAYSGPASSYGTIGKSEAAYFAMINEQGGVNGRKSTLSVATMATAHRKPSNRFVN